MSTQHTFGPHHVTADKDPEHYRVFTVRASNGFPLATLAGYHGGEAEGNATLYAAATEMLEALRMCLRNSNLTGPDEAAVLQAIAKATAA